MELTHTNKGRLPLKIWKLQADANHFNNFTLIDNSEWGILINLDSFSGLPMIQKWKPFKVKVLKQRKEGDMQAFLGGVPVFSQKAVDKLRDFFHDNTELLPLDYNKGQYYALNILNILDCIHYENAEFTTFSDGKIMRFEKYAFQKSKILDEHFFKIVDEPRGFSFVSDAFKAKVIDSGLSGFLFSEVWDSTN